MFTRYHEAGVTRIRLHENTAAKLCKRILGYDANALYLSTMLNDMPRGKEKMTDYKDPVQKAIELKNAIISGKLFGFVKCKLATPKTLWAKFEEMPPIFCEPRSLRSRCVEGYAGLLNQNRAETYHW